MTNVFVEIVETAPTVSIEDPSVAITVDDVTDIVTIEVVAAPDIQIIDTDIAIEVVDDSTAIIEVEVAPNVVVDVEASPVVIVEIMPEGSGGGAVEASNIIELEAASAIGGHRVVHSLGNGTIDIASSDDVTHINTIIGITTGAVIQGDMASVQLSGDMIEPSFTFVPGPIYFNDVGVLTQTRPVTGFIQQVAVSVSATEIVVQLGVPVVLQ